MKVLFFSNMGLAPLHLGMELELMKNAQKADDELFVLKCSEGIKSCFFNPCHNLLGCAICTARTDRFHNLLGIPKENIFSFQSLLPSNFETPVFKNLDELMGWTYQGYKLGSGIASSVISLERDYNIVDNERQTDLIKVQTQTAVNALLNFKRVIKKVKPDLVYLFNGRFSEQFPLLELCLSNNIKVKTYECGSNKKKYQVFDNALPHSIQGIKEVMAKLWQEKTEIDKKAIAEEWYTRKRLGTSVNRVNFIKNQKKGKLPPNFDKTKRNIVFFNSSEDEMKAIEEWQTPLFRHQNEVIVKVLNHFAEKHPTFHFYVRMHPNLAKVDNIQTQELYHLKSTNLTLLRPKDIVDSFALVDACEKIITFGSTIGIESTFWGKPSILFGRSFYESLNAVYTPDSYTVLFELILKKGLIPKPKANTFPYAYYLDTCGTEFEHFIYEGKLESSFSGEKMDRITFSTFLHFIKSLPSVGLWRNLNKIVLGQRLGFKNLFKLKSHTVG